MNKILKKIFTNNNKVYVPLRCRLANQMFEYAMVRSVALETGGTPVLYKYDENDFLLDCFELCPKLEFAPDSYHSALNVIGKRLQVASVKPNETNAQRYAREKKDKYWLALFGIFHCEVGYTKVPTWLMWHRNVHCFGWFQAENYFKKYEDVIRKELTFKSEIHEKCKSLADEMESCESVCLHIRLGDYLDPKYAVFKVCDKSYYERAVAYIRERIPHTKFFVFTDSPDVFLHEYHIPDTTLIPEHYSGAESMYLGTRCKHHIMSNSSYSWWMQYLGKHEGQIVVAPKRWFTDDQIVDGLYMKHWTTL